MKLLLLLVLTGVAYATLQCGSKKGETLIQFNGHSQEVLMPCKYHAVHNQQCGPYKLVVSPGNIWIYPNYQLDTLWLGIENTETGEFWEGRTTNKLAVKYLNSEGQRALFNKKDGTVATEDEFEFGRDQKIAVFIKDKADTFKVTFSPWDPDNKGAFAHSDWKFECNDDSAVLVEYPEQICGGNEQWPVKDRAEALGMSDKYTNIVILYDTLTNPTIAQTNPKCVNATDMLVNLCKTDEQRLEVIQNCREILMGRRHVECVTHYSCEPMDVFNACVLWGCQGDGFDPKNKKACEEVAEGVDFCPEFGRTEKNPKELGNLTQRIEAANCFKDFLPIRDDIMQV